MTDSTKLTHLDEHGAARVVDVSGKPETRREAIAECFVPMAPATAQAIRESSLAKGDALAVARVAGIMGAKKTLTSSRSVTRDCSSKASRWTSTCGTTG